MSAFCAAPWKCGYLRLDYEVAAIDARTYLRGICKTCHARIADWFEALDQRNGFTRHYSDAELDRMEADYEVTQRMAPLG